MTPNEPLADVRADASMKLATFRIESAEGKSQPTTIGRLLDLVGLDIRFGKPRRNDTGTGYIYPIEIIRKKS